jgi:hypothetical protein
VGMIEAARDALKDIPISEVLRERLSLTVDRLEETENKVGSLQSENGGLQAKLEREQLDHEQTKQELQKLRELLQEDVRFVRGVEFRRGARTGGKWEPFCPKCHLPVTYSHDPTDPIFCNDFAQCKWHSGARSWEVQQAAAELS